MIKPDHSPYTSPAFQKRVDVALNGLPAPVNEALNNAGWQVKTGRTLSDADPEAQKVLPGVASGPTTMMNPPRVYETTPGVCVGPQESDQYGLRSTILIAENTLDGFAGVNEAVENVEGVVRHEVGHSIDHLTSRLSLSNRFKAAYEADMAALDGKDDIKKDLAYFMRDGAQQGVGQRETFAELQAAELGGGIKGTALAALMPNSLKLVQQVQQNLQNGLAGDHGIDRQGQAFQEKSEIDGAEGDFSIDIKGWKAQFAAREELAATAAEGPSFRIGVRTP